MRYLTTLILMVVCVMLTASCESVTEPHVPHDPTEFESYFFCGDYTSCKIRWDVCLDPDFAEYRVYLATVPIEGLTPYEMDQCLRAISYEYDDLFHTCCGLEEGRTYYARVVVKNTAGGSTYADCSGYVGEGLNQY